MALNLKEVDGVAIAPKHYGINVGCLEGVNPLKIAGVPTYDGVNHPADRER